MMSTFKLLGPLLVVMIIAKSGFGLMSEVENSITVHNLEEKNEKVTISKYSKEKLEVFCHSGQETTISRFWTSSVFRLRINTENYRVFLGPNSTAVIEDYDQSKQNWFYSSFSSSMITSKDIKLNPFLRTCVGIVATDDYSLILHIYRVNYWQVVMTLCGLFLFFYSRKLCQNVFFHYATGVTAGIAFSLLVCVYFVQKKLKAGFFGWILGFYSLSLYFLTSFWYNMRDYILDNQVYVMGYLVTSGAISFAICYRMGPIENPRSLNLIQWALQLFALVLIYISSYHQVASLALSIGVLTWTAIPNKTKTKVQCWYKKKFFKPKIKLLSESEYLDQSRVETEKALDSLRSFCQSPKCDAWKYTSRLKSPHRFAEFVQGSPHVEEEEVMNYSHADFNDLMESAGDISNDSGSRGWSSSFKYQKSSSEKEFMG